LAPINLPAGPINTVGSGMVPVTVTSAGTAPASLALACTIPPGAASFAITAGGNRTIDAPATLGANAPAIGVSCTRQAAATVGTLTCTQTASPGPNPASLTAAITCPAGTVSPNPGTNPPSGTPIPLVGPPSTVVTQQIAFTNTGGSASYTATCTLVPAGGGYTVSGSPVTVAAGATGNVTVGCTTPASPGTSLAPTTLQCVTGDLAVIPLANFPITCRAEQIVAVPSMTAGGKALMAVLFLMIGLVAVQMYRRSA